MSSCVGAASCCFPFAPAPLTGATASASSSAAKPPFVRSCLALDPLTGISKSSSSSAAMPAFFRMSLTPRTGPKSSSSSTAFFCRIALTPLTGAKSSSSSTALPPFCGMALIPLTGPSESSSTSASCRIALTPRPRTGPTSSSISSSSSSHLNFSFCRIAFTPRIGMSPSSSSAISASARFPGAPLERAAGLPSPPRMWSTNSISASKSGRFSFKLSACGGGKFPVMNMPGCGAPEGPSSCGCPCGCTSNARRGTASMFA
mmetsp:Transcript_65074/g.108085  ORF Transcript_65074/g.108085 Transcript_65074/m.108085 type:complete len:260 (-) Transcript_65074:11-790(-)